MKSLRYAVNARRKASSYESVGEILEELGIPDAAEAYLRKAVELDSSDTLAQRMLAELLVERKRYTEAETIYIQLLLADSDPSHRMGIYHGLEKIMRATNRESKADEFGKKGDEAAQQAH